MQVRTLGSSHPRSFPKSLSQLLACPPGLQAGEDCLLGLLLSCISFGDGPNPLFPGEQAGPLCRQIWGFALSLLLGRARALHIAQGCQVLVVQSSPPSASVLFRSHRVRCCTNSTTTHAVQTQRAPAAMLLSATIPFLAKAKQAPATSLPGWEAELVNERGFFFTSHER